MTDIPNKADVLARIERFTETRTVTEGRDGWPKIDPADVQEMLEIFSLIRDLRFGPSASGDPAIEIELVDRTRGRRPDVPFLPYLNRAEDEKEMARLLAQHVEAAQHLSTASGDILRIVSLHMRGHMPSR